MNSTAAQQVPLPHPEQSNFASVEVLKDVAQPPKDTQKTFSEFVDGTTKTLEDDRNEVWLEIISGCELITHFIEGRQDLVRGHRSRRWRVVNISNNTSDPVRALPKLGFYVQNLIAKGVNGRADCDVLPGDDLEKTKGAARKGQAILDWLEERVYSEHFRQTEILNGITAGLKARYYRWSTDGDYGFADRPIYQDVPVRVGGGWYCPDCEAGGENLVEESTDENGWPTELQSGCAECGSPSVLRTEGAQTTATKQVGSQRVKKGMPECTSVHLSQLRFDLSVPLERSHWLRYEQRVPKDRLRALVPGINLDKAFEEQNFAAEMQERLASSTPFNVGQSQRKNEHYCTVVTWWFDPCVYSHIELREPLQTLSGQTYPAGTKLGDVLQTGMCLVMIKGIKQPLGVFDEHHKDHWVSAPYHIRLLSGIGNGVGEAVEAQRQWNLLMALIFEQIRTAATPGTIYDKDVISPDDADLIGVAAMNIPAQTGQLPQGKGLKDAIVQLQGQTLPQHVTYYKQDLDYLMQSSTNSIDFSGAIPGVDNNTFGGAQLGQSLAQSLHDPIMALQADMDERGATIMLKLFQRHAVDAYWVPKVGTRDNYEGENFSQADIDCELYVKAKPGSWRSRTDFEQREAFERSLNVLAAFGGPLAAPPQIVRQVAELYGTKYATETLSAQARLCRIRLDQIKTNATQADAVMRQMIAQAPEAAEEILGIVGQQLVATITPPVDPEEPGHETSVEYLREWFLQDEGITASPVFRAGVKALITVHMMAWQQEQAVKAQAMATSADTMVGEAQADANAERGAQQKQIPRSDQQKKLDGAKKNSSAQMGRPQSPARQPQQSLAA